jgi:hypothetical protein
VCRLRVRNQAKRLHDNGPPPRTSTLPRSWSPEDRTPPSCEGGTLGGYTTQRLNSGLKHSTGIRDHMGVRVRGRQEKGPNCINLKDRWRINFSLINWYR